MKIMDTEWKSLLVVESYTLLLLFNADLGLSFISYTVKYILIHTLEDSKLVSDQQQRGRICFLWFAQIKIRGLNIHQQVALRTEKLCFV